MSIHTVLLVLCTQQKALDIGKEPYIHIVGVYRYRVTSSMYTTEQQKALDIGKRPYSHTVDVYKCSVTSPMYIKESIRHWETATR